MWTLDSISTLFFLIINGTLVILHIYCQPLIWFLSSGSPDDWECFLHYIGCLLEDDSSWCNGDPIHRSNPLDCKLPHLTDEVVHILAFTL